MGGSVECGGEHWWLLFVAVRRQVQRCKVRRYVSVRNGSVCIGRVRFRTDRLLDSEQRDRPNQTNDPCKSTTLQASKAPSRFFYVIPGVKPGCNRTMDLQTQCARITGPVAYLSGTGRKQNIPLGPCIVENMGDRLVDVIWGARGQRSVAIPIEDIKAAQARGHIEILASKPA